MWVLSFRKRLFELIIYEDRLKNELSTMFIAKPDNILNELLEIYNTLSLSLKKYLLNQIKELQAIQNEETSYS